MAEMKDVVGSLLGRWAVPALKVVQIVSFVLFNIIYGIFLDLLFSWTNSNERVT